MRYTMLVAKAYDLHKGQDKTDKNAERTDAVITDIYHACDAE